MTYREKVIKGIVHCDFGGSGTCYEKECPYYQSHDCTDELKNDILILLKEQEAKPVKVVKNAYNHEFYYCPRCDRSFYGPWVKTFCDRCGQALKWEDR